MDYKIDNTIKLLEDYSSDKLLNNNTIKHNIPCIITFSEKQRYIIGMCMIYGDRCCNNRLQFNTSRKNSQIGQNILNKQINCIILYKEYAYFCFCSSDIMIKLKN